VATEDVLPSTVNQALPWVNRAYGARRPVPPGAWLLGFDCPEGAITRDSYSPGKAGVCSLATGMIRVLSEVRLDITMPISILPVWRSWQLFARALEVAERRRNIRA
jgi:hypothetical protein